MRAQVSCLADLGKVGNGIVEVAFKTALRQVLDDLETRPSVDSAREVTVKVSLKPVQGDSGILEAVETEFDIRQKMPSYRSRSYSMAMSSNGLEYNDLSPDDHRQMTLDQEPVGERHE